MEKREKQMETRFNGRWIFETNKGIIIDLNESVITYKCDIMRLKRKLSWAYWAIIIFSSLTFFTGLLLLLVPAIAAFRGEAETLTSLVTGGFGIADLVALFIYRPFERIHQIMGDMSQIILVLNSYEYQVGLTLVEMDINDKLSIAAAADKIGSVASTKIAAVEKYFESVNPKENSYLRKNG